MIYWVLIKKIKEIFNFFYEQIIYNHTKSTERKYHKLIIEFNQIII